MNAIVFTEGATLKMFFQLINELESHIDLENIGIHVCDSRFFHKFKEEFPQIESGKYTLYKEWEIIRESKNMKPDIQRLRAYEEEIGAPFLWDALLCERRIYLGKHSTLEQDYRKRYSHDRMLSILQLCIERTRALFDEVRPDFVLSFISVTISGYIGYLLAKEKKIKYLNLRPTRIRNYIHAGDTVTWPSTVASDTYNKFIKTGLTPELEQKARECLSDFRDRNLKYEGAPFFSSKSNK